MNETAKDLVVQNPLPVVSGGLFFDVQKFEHAQRVARLLASSSMVPEQFRGDANLGNCVIALNYAERLGTDPFMLMQNMYVVHGRPGIEAKLVIALVNSCSRFTPLEFRMEGAGKSRKCVAYATHLKSGKVLESPEVTWEIVEAEGWNKDKTSKTGPVQKSKWNTMPELMFRYRSATFFARTFCPEVLLGMRTMDEIEDILEMEVGQSGVYESVEHKTEQKKEALKERIRGKKKAQPEPQSQEVAPFACPTTGDNPYLDFCRDSCPEHCLTYEQFSEEPVPEEHVG